MKNGQKHSGIGGTPISEKKLASDITGGLTKISRDTINRLKQGDTEAFRAVFMTYHTPLEKFLSALLRSPSDAEEFAQQIMMEIWEKREGLDPSKNIGGLIYTMAKREAFSFIRHKYVRQKYVDETISKDAADFSLSGEEIVIASETEILQEFILSRMPEKRRQIYELSRNEGLTYQEISQKLNLSQKSVEYHMSQALKDFREVLALFLILII